MEDNFAPLNYKLRYVFTYPGIISRAELVPSNGASRRRLGDNTHVAVKDQIYEYTLTNID
jgi:hypothetical protein